MGPWYGLIYKLRRMNIIKFGGERGKGVNSTAESETFQIRNKHPIKFAKHFIDLNNKLIKIY